MNTKLSGLLGAVLMLTTMVASAGNQTPRADAREARQDARIVQGVASGELTTREVVRLEARQEHIENVEDRAKADGTVTAAERRKLERKQDRSSRAIHRRKHDGQDHD